MLRYGCNVFLICIGKIWRRRSQEEGTWYTRTRLVSYLRFDLKEGIVWTFASVRVLVLLSEVTSAGLLRMVNVYVEGRRNLAIYYPHVMRHAAVISTIFSALLSRRSEHSGQAHHRTYL